MYVKVLKECLKVTGRMKINQTFVSMKYIVSMAASIYKWFNFSFFSAILLFAGKNDSTVPGSPLWANGGLHPFHVGVVEIEHNAADKTLEISCKIFTDDFETTLAKNYNAKVDLINPPNIAAMDTLVKKYILSHLSLKVNGKPVSFTYVGFEHENEAVFGYIEVVNIQAVSKLEINNSIMYDKFDDQVNIMHVKVTGERKSTKLNYPEKEAVFNF